MVNSDFTRVNHFSSLFGYEKIRVLYGHLHLVSILTLRYDHGVGEIDLNVETTRCPVFDFKPILYVADLDITLQEKFNLHDVSVDVNLFLCYESSPLSFGVVGSILIKFIFFSQHSHFGSLVLD